MVSSSTWCWNLHSVVRKSLHSKRLGKGRLTFPSIESIWKPEAFLPVLSVSPEKVRSEYEEVEP